MKTLILVLILISFLQSTVIPLNLVLIILIVRAYIAKDKYDLYLAFSFGLLIAHLNSLPLGPMSIIYLSLVGITETLAKSQFSQNVLTVIILISALLGIFHIVTFLLGYQTLPQIWPKIFIEIVISIPLYYLIMIWEERFIFKRDIKLKV